MRPFFGFHYARGEREASVFWGLVTVSFVLMLIEDAGNPRHRIAYYLVNYLGWSRLAIEGTLYVLISFPIIIAFLRYWKVPFIYPQTRLYLLTGAFLYGGAASSSVFRFQDDYYYDLGDKISDLLLEGVVPGFWLMDYVIEEAVELLAAATSNSTANGACSFIVQNFF